MSQTFESGTSNTYKLRLVVTENSTNTSGNISSISYKLYMVATTAKYYQSGVNETYKVTINGTTYTHTVKTYFSSGNIAIQIGSGSGISVAHNADGTKALNVSASYTKASSTSYAPSGNMSLSGTMTLTAIPRASTISVSNGNGTKPGNGTIALTISRASSTFTHTVTWACGGLSGTVGTGLSTSASWAVPLSLIEKSPNADQTVTFTCTTYNGSTSIGSKTCTATVGHHNASIISAQSGDTLGSTMTFTISRSHSNLTHSLWYSFGSKTWQAIGSSIATSKSFTPPLSLCSELPNATSGSMTIILRTYYGSTQIGSDQYKYYTMNVPDSVIPSFTDISCIEANDEAKTLVGAYVQNKSCLTLSIVGAVGSQGSTIQSYKIAVAGQSINAQSGTTQALNVSGSQTIVATITDSRGRMATQEKVIDILPYINPKISDVVVYRHTDTTANITASLSCSSLLVQAVEKNHLCYKIEYKPSSASSYTSVTGEYEELSATLSRTLSGLHEAKSYEIHIFVGDIFGYNSVYEIQRLSTAFKSFDFDVKTGRLGIKKVLEHEDSVLEMPEGTKIYVGDTALTFDQNNTWENIQGKPTTYPPSAHTHDCLTDRSNGTACYLNYGAAGLTTASWLAAWNGYELRAISPANLRSVIGAAATSHSHSYLPLSGGTMTGALSSSLTTGNYLSGNQGTAIINSTASAGAYTMLAKLNSTNGVFTMGVNGTKLIVNYTNRSTIQAGTNAVTNDLYFHENGVLETYRLYSGSYTCVHTNEIVINTSAASCWFGYRTNSGYTKITTWNFGDGANGKGTIACKSLSQSSDRKYKDHIKTIEKYKEFILGLEPVEFTFKDGSRKHMGFIAQDVCKLVKDIQMGDLSIYQASVIDQESGKADLYFDENVDDENLSWNLTYSEFIAPLVATVQYQQQEIDILKEKMNFLMTMQKKQ